MTKDDILRKNKYIDGDGFIDICAIHKSMDEHTELKSIEFLNYIEDGYYLIKINPKIYVPKVVYHKLINGSDRFIIGEMHGIDQNTLYQIFISKIK